MKLSTSVLLLAPVVLCGCAPYAGSCGWVVPEAGDSIRVVEARKPTVGDCECINCEAPGKFVLQREKYSLEFWNGDRYYPILYVRGRNPQRAELTLSTDEPEFIRMGTHVPSRDTYGYEYFVYPEPRDGKAAVKTLKITVLDAAGKVLGVETLELRVEFRDDWRVEGL